MSKVLLVDNETSRAAAIGESLERGGFETISAKDGNEALRTFLNEVPDLVMVGPLAANPDEDFCRRLRETRPGVHTPIILYCEALGGEGLKAALEHSGCNVYLEMPTSDERLFEVCRHALVEAVGSTAKAVPAEVSTTAASEPAFASPDAATAELATSGQDIDAHLDSMFETGAPPVAEWTAEPEVSFETDMAAGSAEPAEPAPTPPREAEERQPPGGYEQPDLGDEVELVGFESDTMAFEQAGENDPGIQPDYASEAHSLVDHPAEPASPAEAETTRDAAQTEVASPVTPAPPEAVYVDADSPAAAVDFSLGEAAPHDEAPPIELLTEPVKHSSRGWLWGLIAAAALAGIATFAIFRPSGETTEPVPVASRPPVTTPVAEDSNPLVETQAAADAAFVAQLDPVAAEVAGNDVTNPDAIAAAEPPVEVAEPPPSDTTHAVASDIEETAAETIAVEATNAGPETAEVDTPAEPTMIASAIPAEPAVATPAPTPAPAKPRVEDNFVFQPSTEIVDAATVGEGFTPATSINRELPVYKAADVPAGGETVVLRVLVNDWGKAVRVDVEKGRRGSPLVEAAIDAVLNTRYTPADLRGQQVRAWATETFVFE